MLLFRWDSIRFDWDDRIDDHLFINNFSDLIGIQWNFSIDRWLVPPKPKDKKKSFVGFLTSLRPYQLTKPYMKNNYVYIAFISLFLIVNAALFVSRIFQYRRWNGYVILARACGNITQNFSVKNNQLFFNYFGMEQNKVIFFYFTTKYSRYRRSMLEL